MSFESLVARMIAPLERRVRSMIVRCVLEAASDGTGFQAVRVMGLADSTTPDIEHMQPGGVSHVPAGGAEGLLVSVGADGSHQVAILLSSRSGRPKSLAEGETVLYSTGPTPAKIVLKANGDVEITPGGLTPKLVVNGDVEVTGNVSAIGEVSAVATTPLTAVNLSTHMHPTAALGPPSPPTPGPPPP